MTRIEVALTDEQVAALEQLASRRESSLAALIQEGVDRLLQSATCPGGDLKARALAVAGRFRSGCGDLARRHDDYLAGAPER